MSNTKSNINPATPSDKLLNYLLKTTRCFTCGNDYPNKLEMCPHCEHVYSEDLDNRVADAEYRS